MVQRAGFAAEVLPCPIDPDVHGLDLVPLRQLHVHVLDSFAQVGARRGGHGCRADKGVPAREDTKNNPSRQPFPALPDFSPPRTREEHETAQHGAGCHLQQSHVVLQAANTAARADAGS